VGELDAMKTLLLAWITSVLILPAQAKYGGGIGTVDDPYRIATATDLIALGESPEDYDKVFLLVADIDLDPNLSGGQTFDKAVIAADMDPNDQVNEFSGTAFTGVFDGGGHRISRLTIEGQSYVGLFGRLGETAAVRDLCLADVNVSGSGEYIAGVAAWNEGEVSHCSSTGSAAGRWSVSELPGHPSVLWRRYSGDCVAGLVGSNRGQVNHCYSIVFVNGRRNIGGLVAENSGKVLYSYSVSEVTGGTGHVGGLIGENLGDVANCYSAGAVIGSGESHGGLIGRNSGDVRSCYSTGAVSSEVASFVGGLVGENSGTAVCCYSTGSVNGGVSSSISGLAGAGGWVMHCLWDIETSGVTQSVDGVGLTTAEMMDSDMLGQNGFANNPNWVLDSGRDYPRLTWEGTSGQMIPEPNIDWLEGDGTSESPYRIETADQLMLLARASMFWERYSTLQNDIDLDPNLPGRQVFGRALFPSFTGVFKGRFHVISHLTIEGDSYLGLFGQVASAAVVQDLGLIDVTVTGSGDYVGGLAGQNFGTISRCRSTGTVNGNNVIGGLIGLSEGAVSQCYSAGAVLGERSIGGLVGRNDNTISECYSLCISSGWGSVGGLVGWNNEGNIAVCYSAGAVVASRNPCIHIGRLVGQNTNGSIQNCLWDVQSVEAFQSKDGWDFVFDVTDGHDEVWWIREGESYPALWWEDWPSHAFNPQPEDGTRSHFYLSPVISWYSGLLASFHDVYFGEDEGLVSQGTTGDLSVYRGRLPEGATCYEPGELKYLTTYYWRIDGIDEADPDQVSTGPVWSFTTRGPVIPLYPEDGGTTNVVMLRWAREPGTQYNYDVYLGDNKESVSSATAESRDIYRGRFPTWTTSYQPAENLRLGVTYYWRIDALENGNPPNIIKGGVWAFTVGIE